MVQEVPLRFFVDRYGASDCEVLDPSWRPFASFLVSDLQSSTYFLLDVLEGVEDVRAARSPLEEVEGNSWAGQITPAGLSLADLDDDDDTADYSLDQAHAGLLAYWEFLTGGPGAKRAGLQEWESRAGHEHPCRDHLGLDG